jgi:hypothetical protein
MAITDIELKQMLVDFVTTNPGWTWAEANEETDKFGLHHKTTQQLYDLQMMYEEKMRRVYRIYKENRHELIRVTSDSYVESTSEDDIGDLKTLKAKAVRVAQKWRAVNAEVAGREANKFGPGLEFDRKYVE